MKGTYFEGVEVGDTVFYLGRGEGKVTRISSNDIEVSFYDESNTLRSTRLFTFEGIREVNMDTLQTLFWSDPKVIAPQKQTKEFKYNSSEAIHFIQRASEGITKITVEYYE